MKISLTGLLGRFAPTFYFNCEHVLIVNIEKQRKKNFADFWCPTKNLGPIGSAVLTFIGYKRTDRQAKYLYRLLWVCLRFVFAPLYWFLNLFTAQLRSMKFIFQHRENIKTIKLFGFLHFRNCKLIFKVLCIDRVTCPIYNWFLNNKTNNKCFSGLKSTCKGLQKSISKLVC